MTNETRTIWQDIEIRLPADWEMTRFGRRYEQGACTFSDALHERLQLAWQRTASCPDLARLLSDLKAKESAAAGKAGSVHMTELAGPDGWIGFALRRDRTTTTRAARYFEDAATLIEVTLSWQGRRDKTLEEELLGHVRVLCPSDWRAWRAFGIDAEVPTALHLAECRCLPGNAELVFRSARPHPSVTIRRLGFPSAWLKQKLSDWLKTRIPEPFTATARRAETVQPGHELVHITSVRPKGHLGKITRKQTWRHDWASLCPREERVYHVSAETDTANERPARLRCACGALLPGHAGGRRIDQGRPRRR